MATHDSNALQHLIKHRRSIFPDSYTDRELSKDTLLRLLECANAAPTHKLTQPWRFTVFRGDALRRLADKLASLYQEHTPAERFLQKKHDATRRKVLRSGAVIVINIHYSGEIPQWEELAATACAVQNLWLAAAAEGIGAYWSSPGTIKHLGDFLGLGEDEACLGFFYMGYHEEPPREANRTPIAEKIQWEEH